MMTMPEESASRIGLWAVAAGAQVVLVCGGDGIVWAVIAGISSGDA